MRVMVTGSAGYLGRAVLSVASADPALTVVATAREGGSSAESGHPIRLDVADPEAVAEAIRFIRPDAVLHLAGHLPRPEDLPEEGAARSCRDNRLATQFLAEAAREAGVTRFVHASSISVYAPEPADGVAHGERDVPAPVCTYGCDKAAAERAVEAAWSVGHGARAAVLRFAGIHGPPRRTGAIHRFCRAAVSGEPLEVAEPDSRFSFLFVADAAAACLLALRAPLPAGTTVVNIGGEEATLGGLAEAIVSLAGSSSRIVAGSGPTRRQVLRIDRARAVFGFRPSPLTANLRCCLDFARADAGRS